MKAKGGGVPEVSPEKRGSLWHACYAVAFWEIMQSRPIFGGATKKHKRKSAVMWALAASEAADLAVFLLAEADKEDR